MKPKIVTIIALIWCGLAAAGPANVLANSAFDDGAAGWRTYGASRYRVVAAVGRGENPCLQYCKPPDGAEEAENSHHDQEAPVEPNTVYVAGAWFKSDGALRPALRIATMEWQSLAVVSADVDADWREIRVAFNTCAAERVRFQIFGGALNDWRESASGMSLCDDAFLRKATQAELDAMRTCRVTVDASQVVQRVNPMFFGVNTLFVVEDDASRADGKVEKYLRAMPCGLMRFPGGEMADNYHWKTQRLDDPNEFPHIDGPATMDTDEFMVLCRKVGADPIFVVNLESCFVRGDMGQGIREAADWVQYCNIDKNYNVRYWEIGNESDLKGTRYPLTARQYAEALVAFSRAMKAVDPSIKIGALGPHSVKTVAQFESVPPEERAAFRRLGKDEKNRTYTRLVQTGRAQEGEPWWPTVVQVAARHMDFAVIHRYSSPDTYGHFMNSPVTESESVVELRRYFSEQFPDRHIPIALTEWNTNKDSGLRGWEQGLVLAEKIGRYLTAGVDMANFWPLRYRNGESADRAMLNYATNEPRPPYYVMQLYASNIGARIVGSTSTNPSVYSCAGLSDDGGVLSLFLVNKSIEMAPCRSAVAIEGSVPSSVSAVTLTSEPVHADEAEKQPLNVALDDGKWVCELPPHSVTLVRFRR